MQKVDLKSMTFAELQQFVEDLGEKKFRTTQLYQWMHQKMVKEFASMTNLSAAFRTSSGISAIFVLETVVMIAVLILLPSKYLRASKVASKEPGLRNQSCVSLIPSRES